MLKWTDASQKSFIGLFSRIRYTVGASLAVQKETTHERYTETRHGIPRPAIGVSVLSSFNIQRYLNASSKSYPIRTTSCRESPLT
jgi:hypothetical protein